MTPPIYKQRLKGCALDSCCVLALTGALNKELLSMAAQQGTGEEGGKVHKDLSK